MEQVIIWGIISVIAQIAKSYWVDQKYVVTVLSIVCWTVRFFISPADQQRMIESMTQIAGSATIIYNLFKTQALSK